MTRSMHKTCALAASLAMLLAGCAAPAPQRVAAAPDAKAAASSPAGTQRDVVGCVSAGARAGDYLTLREWGLVRVKSLSNNNTECGANGMTISSVTATFTVLKALPSTPAPADIARARTAERQLRELKRMRARNVITQEQFEEREKAILAEQ